MDNWCCNLNEENDACKLDFFCVVFYGVFCLLKIMLAVITWIFVGSLSLWREWR